MKERTRPPAHPGAIIERHYLEPLGLSITDAAIALGVARKTVSKIVNEHGAITSDMALRLGRAFNTSPQLWLNLQHNYDLWHASHESQEWKRVHTLMAKATGIYAPAA
ncbi:MAG: HigA family addiction module antitoxin [Elusimicrobiota bacterium]